jgi:hypothetical protein
VGAPATFERVDPTYRMRKKTTEARHKMRRSDNERESARKDECGRNSAADHVYMVRAPWDHARRRLSTAGWNDPSIDSVGSSPMLRGIADRDTPRKKTQQKKKSTETA